MEVPFKGDQEKGFVCMSVAISSLTILFYLFIKDLECIEIVNANFIYIDNILEIRLRSQHHGA